MVKLDDLAVTYKWSRRRKSIGLSVTTDGKLVIHAPYGTPPAKIAQVVAKHRAWIERQAAARREAWARLKEGEAFYLGQPYRLTLGLGAREAVELGTRELRVWLKRADDPGWPALRAWYRRQGELIIQARLRAYSAQMGLTVARVEVRDWKSRWGEYRPGARGLLRFNWRLILLPAEILDYVVVHELAHLKEPGHTPSFWLLVSKVLPDYAPRRRWLNHYGAPFLLWQPSGSLLPAPPRP